MNRKLAADIKRSISADVKGDAVKRVLDVVPQKGGKKMNREEKVRSDVEADFSTQKKFLLMSYERAMHEEQLHLK